MGTSSHPAVATSRFLLPALGGLDLVSFDPLERHLGSSLGVPLRVAVEASYDALRVAIEAGAAALLWAPPAVAAQLLARDEATPVAIVSRRGSTSYPAVLVARADDARALEDFRGAKIAWVSRQSAAGYLLPRAYLAGRGLDVATFFAEETFHDKHVAALDAVAAGNADLAATWAVRGGPSGATRVEGRPELRVVAHVGLVPNELVVLAPSAHIEPQTARRALTTLPDEALAPLRTSFGIERLMPVASHHLALFRALGASTF